MLVTSRRRRTVWEAVLPPGYQDLPVELARVDALLDDPVFFAPYREHFSARLGRPSIPIETYLRMMFLKHRHGLGYETLCQRVADSLSWLRFCRINLGERIPHPSTLEKLTTRCGPETIEQLNRALLAKGYTAKVIKINKVRTDTTVIPANVAYPTDSGLLATAIDRIAVLVARVHAAGGAPRTHARDRRRSARRRDRAINAHLKLRTDEAKAAVLRITGELADLAERAVAEATPVLANTRHTLRRRGDTAPRRLPALAEQLATVLHRTTTVIEQTRTRLAGQTPPGATRLVSLHEPDARPIVKGRLGKRVEFGFKGEVTDNTDGVIVDYGVHQGNPPDASLLAPAIGRITGQAGHPPTTLTADRSYGEAGIEQALTDLGVTTTAIPHKGKPGKARRDREHSRPFHRLVKWRTGSEGRIACLKRQYGWGRSLLDGTAGTRIWCGLGVFAHNLVKITGLLAARQARNTRRQHRPANEPPTPGTHRPPGGSGPPPPPPIRPPPRLAARHAA
jgi:IS5 family transposase